MPEVIIYEVDPLIAEDLRGIAATLKPEWRAAIFDDTQKAENSVVAAGAPPCLLIARSVDPQSITALLVGAAQRGIPTVLIADEAAVPAQIAHFTRVDEPFTNASLAEAIAAVLHV